jgi:hypothetical protein
MEGSYGTGDGIEGLLFSIVPAGRYTYIMYNKISVPHQIIIIAT